MKLANKINTMLNENASKFTREFLKDKFATRYFKVVKDKVSDGFVFNLKTDLTQKAIEDTTKRAFDIADKMKIKIKVVTQFGSHRDRKGKQINVDKDGRPI